MSVIKTIPTDTPTGQPDLGNLSLRLSSEMEHLYRSLYFMSFTFDFFFYVLGELVSLFSNSSSGLVILIETVLRKQF